MSVQSIETQLKNEEETQRLNEDNYRICINRASMLRSKLQQLQQELATQRTHTNQAYSKEEDMLQTARQKFKKVEDEFARAQQKFEKERALCLKAEEQAHKTRKPTIAHLQLLKKVSRC